MVLGQRPGAIQRSGQRTGGIRAFPASLTIDVLTCWLSLQRHPVIMVAAASAVHRSGEMGARDRVTFVDGFLSWWDSFELWLSGLGFVPQTLIVMPVVLVLAYGIAVAIDAVLGGGIRMLRSLRGGTNESGSHR